MGRLQDRVAFITGGARGQGRAIAAKFASEGADIVISDICDGIDSVPYAMATRDDLEATRDLIEGSSRRCIAEVADVRDPDGLRALADRAMAELGRIDVVCANAGIVSFSPFLDLDMSTWQDMIDVNLTGVFNTVRAVAPAMMEARRGSIILTSSVAAVEPAPELTHYVAAKHGVLGLMRSFAYELGAHNIRVNTIQPGPILTPMVNTEANRSWAVGRPGATLDEFLDATRNWHLLRGRPALPATAIADAMIWLASDESQHVTGVALPVDAGHMVLPGINMEPIEDEALGRFDYDANALQP